MNILHMMCILIWHNNSNACKNAHPNMIYAMIQMMLLITLIYSVALANRLGKSSRAIHTKVLCPGSDNDTSQRIRCIIVTKIHTAHIINIPDVIHALYTVRGNTKNPAHITPHVRRKNQRRNHHFCFCIVWLHSRR